MYHCCIITSAKSSWSFADIRVRAYSRCIRNIERPIRLRISISRSLFFIASQQHSYTPQLHTSQRNSTAKMVTINCAYTEPINSPNTTPVLTRDQVWKGLQRKIRQAQDFVPVIKGCDVISEKENEVVREAHFKEMEGRPAMSVREVCKSYYPTKVCSDIHLLCSHT